MDDEQPSGTRERILAAAAEIIQEGGVTARLSVRAVAARAGVSSGSLRHHFPTQQTLRDEVMRRVYDWIAPAHSIHDTSIPARDRLVESLREILTAVGSAEQARAAMGELTRTFITGEQSAQVREAYLTIDRDTRHRVEKWLALLAEEEGLPLEGIPGRASLLCTVLSGLGLERALPAEDSLAQRETETLYRAVDAALTP